MDALRLLLKRVLARLSHGLVAPQNVHYVPVRYGHENEWEYKEQGHNADLVDARVDLWPRVSAVHVDVPVFFINRFGSQKYGIRRCDQHGEQPDEQDRDFGSRFGRAKLERSTNGVPAVYRDASERKHGDAD